VGEVRAEVEQMSWWASALISLLAVRENVEKVDARILDVAPDKIVLGAESDTVLTEEVKKRVAYHAGHALLACLLPNADPLAKVTIIPRGRALGATEQMPEEERHTLPEGFLRDCITVMLGAVPRRRLCLANSAVVQVMLRRLQANPGYTSWIVRAVI